MLEEAFSTGRFRKGDTVLLMVPESGRFQIAYAKLKVVASDDREETQAGASDIASPVKEYRRPPAQRPLPRDEEAIQRALADSPLAEIGKTSNDILRYLGVELALVWADFERMLRAVPIVQRIEGGSATIDDYKRLLVNLRQQVVEGARWIARAASSFSVEYFPIRSAVITHAGDEHKDYQMIERDYVALGGTLQEITSQPKNIGSEAFSAFMFHHADQPDPLDLVGAMFVIEGLGKKKAAHWAELLRENLMLTAEQTTFLTYHGKNDENHFAKLQQIIDAGFIDRKMAERIVKTAKTVARLYALQLEEIDNL
jgi:3-oxoacyl-[acyl-carrier-protein] synthase-3